jgi:PAS domain S-box-containing protein
VALLDWFLSESLRRAPPSELSRCRVLVGATLFFLLFALSYLLQVRISAANLSAIILTAGYAGTLALTRRARSPTVPATLFCTFNAVGFLVPTFLSPQDEIGLHAGHMLIPAVSVYLMGLRPAAILTGLYALVLGVIHPMAYGYLTDPVHWPIHFAAAVALMGGWAMGSLHSAARAEAQASLERTLQELHDSEHKLGSLIESTDDPVVSMDTKGRMLTANTAARRFFEKRFGTPLRLGEYLVYPEDEQSMKLWRARLGPVLQGQSLQFEETQLLEGVPTVLDIRLHPLVGKSGKVVGLTLFARDITARKEAEVRLGEMHRSLVDVSRQAGMAEIATGVLHNVGNTLNSVNISTSLLADRLRTSRVAGLTKVATLLREHSSDFASFLLQDPQGQKLPGYLLALSDQCQEERQAMQQEVRALSESVEHLKSIVSMQQKHARMAGAIEQFQVPALIDEALRLHAGSFERLGIRITRDYAQVPPLLADRHKLLQILINLLSNARHAMVASPNEDKRLSIGVRQTPEGGGLVIEVADNGVGIAPEHMPRLFAQGFTTKKTGHGFGLHISALAAEELKGRLSCTSAGPGQGATFTLEIPLGCEEASAAAS